MVFTGLNILDSEESGIFSKDGTIHSEEILTSDLNLKKHVTANHTRLTILPKKRT